MIVEIQFTGDDVKVRRFASDRPNRWIVVRPGGRDDLITGYSHEELRRLGEGLWDFPDQAGSK